MIALIDADALVYIIGWNYRDVEKTTQSEDEVCASCDQMLKDIMVLTGATHYIGVFGPASKTTFRYRDYKYNVYKGNRPPKPEFVEKWEHTIKIRFIDTHKFDTQREDLEADDVVAALQCYFSSQGETSIICSPDKDLQQIPGYHYNYQKEGATPISISAEEGARKLWMQMLMGDSTDNIAGVPGLGEKKAAALFEGLDPIEIPTAVRSAYSKYFGTHYGRIIYEETYLAVRLLDPQHPYWNNYQMDLCSWATKKREYSPPKPVLFQ